MASLSNGAPKDLMLFCIDRFGLKECIETGTFRGDSTEFAAQHFDYVLTIELNDDNFEQANTKLAYYSDRIECWHGDSAELMPGAMQQLDGRAFIWLDAHCVAGQFGDEDACPVLDELDAINRHGEHHIIVIDDAHCFMPPLPMYLTPEAWPVLTDIEDKAAYNGYVVHVAHDMIILATPSDMREIITFIATLPAGRNAMMRRLGCAAEAINGPLKKGAVPAVLPAFTGMTYTQYGWMLVHRFDPAQTPALTMAGQSRDQPDIEMLGRLCKNAGYGAVFVDIGANVGAYSFGVRRFCAEVHAFEPQRIIFNMMCGSVALNGWLNVRCYNVALGRGPGQVEVPQFDYNKALSFGSVEFGPEQREQLSQARAHVAARVEYVELRTLDSYNFPRIDVLKIDVEGMELAVLAGASETIDRCRPIILIEHGKSDKGILRAVLEAKAYEVEDSGTFDFLCTPSE